MAVKAGQQQCAIYALCCPVTGVVRYVGKSVDPARRLRHHLVETRRLPHLHKSRWIASLLVEGLKPEMVVLEWVPEDGWEEAECRHMATYSDLTNSAAGGAGCPPMPKTAEHVARVRAALKGRPGRKGVDQATSKLTEADVLEIRRLRAEGVQGTEVARQFNVTPQLVSLIHRRRAWAHVAEGELAWP